MSSTKVTGGGLAGAVVTLIIWAVTAFTDVDIPPEVTAAGVVIVSFALSYFVKETNPAPSAVATLDAKHAEAQTGG